MNKELATLIILLLDAYKLFHRQMYPTGTSLVYSNSTARSSKHYSGTNKEYGVVFGNQMLLRELHDKFEHFFEMPWEVLEPFLKNQLQSFTGATYAVDHIKELHTLGFLPMRFHALPEGTKCPYGIADLVFWNTLPQFFWLTNYLETWLSNNGWQAPLSATLADEFRILLEGWAMKTVGNTDFVPFQGHDFSMRGMGADWGAISSSLGHAISFAGNDTVPVYLNAQYFYDSGENRWVDFDGTNAMQTIVATSVPATEHSVQCSHYDGGDELAYLDHILDTFPTGIVSIVCDGFDYWKFITEILPQRKERIMAREGKVVVRPDTGDPADIICGTIKSITYKDSIDPSAEAYWHDVDQGNGFPSKYLSCKGKVYEINTSQRMRGYVSFKEVDLTFEQKGSIEVLWDIFGGTVNELGYKELDPHIGLIYGDSINLERCQDICARLAAKGFATTNWVAGIGSFTYRFNTRDSQGRAFKAVYVEVEGQGKAIFKDPKTGDGTKKSAKGLLFVGRDDEGNLVMKDECSWEQVLSRENLLRPVYVEGTFFNQDNLFTIRERLMSH